MSSSEPTSNEVPSERTPEVGGEIVESAVRSSTDSGVLTKPPPHPRSKKRKVHSTNVGANPGATPTNPSPSTVETDEEDSKDEANEGNRKPSRPRSWTWEHFTRDPKSNPSHPRAKCNWCGASYACDSHRNGTTNMRYHLLNQCKKFPRESGDPSQTILTFQQKKEGEGVFTAVTFDAEMCRNALARMIIVDELPFKFVEGEGFRFYMSIVQPRFPLPGRITVAKDCWNLYISEKNRLKTVFKQPNQSICLTTDCWTSVQNLNYMCLTAHYIDHDWKLQKRIINFCLIKNHKGETIGRKIERCLLGWGISRVFTITVDNASSNDTAISYLRTRMEDWNLHPMKGEHLHVRCCAHILNLVVNDGLKEMHESISKIRNAIRYVRASPSRMNRFKNFIKEARIQDKCTVQLDVPTRWNSTYTMLESGLKFQKAFKRLGERDTEYALMQGGIPRNIDWDNAKHFMEFLKIFHDVTKSVSGSLLVTSSQYFHEFCKILRVFKASCGSRDPLLGSMAERMKLKYDKYWGNIKNINMMIFVAVILDPRYKLKFVNFSFEKLYDKDDADFLGAKVKETFSKMFECYMNANNGGRSFTSTTMDGASDVGVPDGDMAGDFFKEVHFHEIINKNEVDLYLMDGLEKPGDQNTFDILNWWKVNSSKYPILSQIARDVLAMPVSTVASESAFSTGGRVLNNYRSSLTPKTVEALICTQNWLRASPMTTDFEELIEEFEKLELEIAPTGEDEDESGVDSD
ncbi:zinc finger BED domain-containing protein RICESLEEPER 2-like [Arachis hypogaea]|uniref:zinc finger BED domain-containing protein RICESLEEPER 2-like n=1 Tax=Arachis hypogaea TaxID=3818 RepID=UPI003B223603